MTPYHATNPNPTKFDKVSMEHGTKLTNEELRGMLTILLMGYHHALGDLLYDRYQVEEHRRLLGEIDFLLDNMENIGWNANQ